jgi:hypothetical protein
VFCSIKGYYFQADIKVSALVSHVRELHCS